MRESGSLLRPPKSKHVIPANAGIQNGNTNTLKLDSRIRGNDMNANLYFAKGGETVAMSELLLRGYNVAIPAVDVGDDIYVVEDAESNLIRVQVKSSNCAKT